VAEERGTRVVGHPALTCLLGRRRADTGPSLTVSWGFLPNPSHVMLGMRGDGHKTPFCKGGSMTLKPTLE